MSGIDLFVLLNSINDSDVSQIIEKITTVSFRNQDIYLGLNDGCVCKVENQIFEDEEEQSFVTSILQKTSIINNVAVKKIDICDVLNTICVLINDSIVFLDDNSLTTKLMNIRLKNVSTFDLKEGLTGEEEYVTEICVGLISKKIQLYLMYSDRINLLKEVVIDQIPLSLSLSRDYVCMACSSDYRLVNLSTGESTQLFQFQSSSSSSTMSTMSKIRSKIEVLPDDKGFLLLGPDGLGIFADLYGSSQRPPIQWSSTVRDFVIYKSHVIAVDHEFITVHNLKSQEQIQTIHFPNSRGCYLVTSYFGASGGVIVIADNSDGWRLCQLVPSSRTRQAEQHLTLGHTDIAVNIVSNILSGKSNINAKSRSKALKVLSVAGFQKFKQKQFKEAKQLFEKANTDLREIIVCFPGLLPKSYRFEPSISTVDSGFQLSADNKGSEIFEYKQFLLDFLLEHRESQLAHLYSQIVETALAKLYVELEPQKLYLNLTMMITDVDYEDLIEYLRGCGYLHACAVVMHWYGQTDAAVDVWSHLIKAAIAGDTIDDQFPGFSFLKEVLLNVSDQNIIVKNMAWLLEYDVISAAEIICRFIRQYKSEKDVINCILNGPLMCTVDKYAEAKFEILVELSEDGLLKDPKLADSLAGMFVEKLKKTTEAEQLERLRLMFIEFLFCCDRFNCSALLKLMQTADSNGTDQSQLDQKVQLVAESIIHGQMGQYETGLHILVDKLAEFSLARRFCMVFENKSTGTNLFLALLIIYLNHCKEGEDNKYKAAALELLESCSDKIAMKDAVLALPSGWPLSRMRRYLHSSISANRHQQLSASMQTALMRMKLCNSMVEARLATQAGKVLMSQSGGNTNSQDCQKCGMSLSVGQYYGSSICDDTSMFVKEVSNNTGRTNYYHKSCYNAV